MTEPEPTTAASGSGEPPKEPSKNALKKAQKEKEKVSQWASSFIIHIDSPTTGRKESCR
jgi:hypothetical protein